MNYFRSWKITLNNYYEGTYSLYGKQNQQGCQNNQKIIMQTKYFQKGHMISTKGHLILTKGRRLPSNGR